MSNDSSASASQGPIVKNIYRNAGDAVYGLGFVGAAVFFIQHSTTFWMGVFGVLKAIVWPALVVYRLLDFLKF